MKVGAQVRPSRCKAFNSYTCCRPPLGTIPFKFQGLAPKWDTLRFHCPLQNRPAEAATPSNYFLCRDPGTGFAPSCLVKAPYRRLTSRSTEPCGIERTLAGGTVRPG